MSQSNRRSEKAGLLRFGREMTSALLMALVFIVYVIQAFKIPTGSMEDSLLVGDFLLGLKFIYGAPVLPYSYKKFPAVADPKPGDVIIFKYPGADKKDYIKRCVAGPGQTVAINGTTLLVDGKEFISPPEAKYMRNGMLDRRISSFSSLYIPRKGDVLEPSSMPLREFLFCRGLIHQENPRAEVRTEFQLFLDGEFANAHAVPFGDPATGREYSVPFGDLRFDFDDWIRTDELLTYVKDAFPDREVEIRKRILLDGKPVGSYTVSQDNYFMMGDNRDNSMDSRYWGYLNRNFVKAKAFILYFSLDKNVPLWQLPVKIRWDRIGKLIRSWDGLHRPAG